MQRPDQAGERGCGMDFFFLKKEVSFVRLKEGIFFSFNKYCRVPANT